MPARVVEREDAADRDVARFRDPPDGRPTPAPTQQALEPDRELADEERQAGQHQELGVIAPRDVVVLGRVDREVVPPGWLLGPGPAVGEVPPPVALLDAHVPSS